MKIWVPIFVHPKVVTNLKKGLYSPLIYIISFMFFFLKKEAENNRLKKPVGLDFVILLLLVYMYLLLLKIGLVGPI